jgi:hypothetical protein
MSQPKPWIRFLFSALFLALGLWQVFGPSLTFSGLAFTGLGAQVHGDLGDARFNLMVLEHTWRWFQGLHPSLFNIPMFAPATNTYSYSDLWFGMAPMYWMFRSARYGMGFDIYGAYEALLIVTAILNFVTFTALARMVARIITREGDGTSSSNALYFITPLAAYFFTFALNRQANLYHPQLWPQFWIVISALGLLTWLKGASAGVRPRWQVLAPWLFVGGAALQFITAFYYFWFWLWTLAVLGLSGVVFFRRELIPFFKIKLKELGFPILFFGGLTAPFLLQYLAAARTVGRFEAVPHSWVAIVATVPRPTSWWMLPAGHWQTDWIPFRDWVLSQPMSQEHILGLGIGTGLLCFAFLALAVAKLWKRGHLPANTRSSLAVIVIPILAMLFFTLVSGRFSPWVLVTYLFPAGQVIRAVGRIQIFMLLFWALLMLWVLVRSSDWKLGRLKLQPWIVALVTFTVVAEAHLSKPNLFSRDESEARITALVAQGQARLDQAFANGTSCDYFYHPPGFLPGADSSNLDAVFAAWRLGFTTVNGYSGRAPRGYANTVNDLNMLLPGQRACEVGQ